MNAEAIQKHLRRENFQPFRVRTSNGSVYRVLEPNWMAITRIDAFIGLEPDEYGVPTRSVYLDVDHIVEVEPIREKLNTPQEPGTDNGTPTGD